MITFSKPDEESIQKLVVHLYDRRQPMLDNWRKACEDDISLNQTSDLSSLQFNNQVPDMLDILGKRLEGHVEEAQFTLLAAEHGLHRWQKGYALAELATETQHLCRLLLSELKAFWQILPLTGNNVIAFTYEHLFEFGNKINTGSISQYADLQRQTASNRVEALQKTLDEINEVGKQRTDLLRHSSHDLRGSFGALQGAASLLEMVMESDEERKQLLTILHHNLSNCRTLVTQLMDLARLEAGHEVLKIQTVDAGQLLAGLVTGYQPLANERGLLLKGAGPVELEVECDPIHLQRIIQNLVLNALKHTPTGWVKVSWGFEEEDTWIVSVQDSGPGLPNVMLSAATVQLSVAANQSVTCQINLDDTDTQIENRKPDFDTAFSHKGEGIGLSIVKGLCELLRANLHIDSRPGEGTTFHIRLSRYMQS